LSEFAVVVGDEVPAGLFVVSTADGNFDPVRGAIIRSPDRAENESVGIFAFIPAAISRGDE